MAKTRLRAKKKMDRWQLYWVFAGHTLSGKVVFSLTLNRIDFTWCLEHDGSLQVPSRESVHIPALESKRVICKKGNATIFILNEIDFQMVEYGDSNSVTAPNQRVELCWEFLQHPPRMQ